MLSYLRDAEFEICETRGFKGAHGVCGQGKKGREGVQSSEHSGCARMIRRRRDVLCTGSTRKYTHTSKHIRS